MGWRCPATPRACPAPGTTISLSALPGSAFSCSRLPELRATALPLARALFRAVAQLAAARRDLRVRSQVWGRAKWVFLCRICGYCGLCGGPGMVLAAPGAACAIRGAKRPHASRKGGALGAGARIRVWLRAICILKQFIVPCMCNRASCTRPGLVCAVRRLLGFVRPLEPANVAGSHHRARGLRLGLCVVLHAPCADVAAISWLPTPAASAHARADVRPCPREGGVRAALARTAAPIAAPIAAAALRPRTSPPMPREGSERRLPPSAPRGPRPPRGR